MSKTLYLDIETSPNVAHVWGLWDQNVSLAQLRESSRTLCFAAKWRGTRKMEFFSEWDDGREVMIQAAHDLLSEADVVGHFNGKRFDVPVLNKEFVLSGMTPPAPFQQIDFLETVRRRFRFPSNKLAYVAEALGVGQKLGHSGHEMWVKVLAGDPAAQKLFTRYCKQDVALLERLHDRLLPWLVNPPNARLTTNGEGCPTCGGELGKQGFALTQVGKFQRYRCLKCGAWSRDTRRSDGTGIRGISA